MSTKQYFLALILTLAVAGVFFLYGQMDTIYADEEILESLPAYDGPMCIDSEGLEHSPLVLVVNVKYRKSWLYSWKETKLFAGIHCTPTMSLSKDPDTGNWIARSWVGTDINNLEYKEKEIPGKQFQIESWDWYEWSFTNWSWETFERVLYVFYDIEYSYEPRTIYIEEGEGYRTVFGSSPNRMSLYFLWNEF